MNSQAADAGVFDDQLLETARVPPGLKLTGDRIYFFWQPPDPRTLDALRRRAVRTPVLIGRYLAEAPVRADGRDYCCPADFFSLRALVDMELAGHDARRAWRGDPPPDYLGMPLVDGDLPRLRFWNEGLPAAAALAALARHCPHLEICTDWLGARLARAAGLSVRRLPWADLRDGNWPPRRWLREKWSSRGGPPMTRHEPPCPPKGQADVVFALAGWVEQRMLDGFPIQELARDGQRCCLWVHRHSAPLYALIAETGAAWHDWPYPPPAANVQALQQAVRNWCRSAAQQGYFAPLRGPLAETFADLMAWPRWVPKAVAMHRLATRWLQKARPGLLVAPAEKDWGPYCALHAARRMGIPTLGVKHAAWPPGSRLERYDQGHYSPSPATHVLAYTPMDAQVNAEVQFAGSPIVQWHGNPRLDRSIAAVGPGPRPLRLLVGASGAGAGRTMSLRRVATEHNIRLIDALHRRIGDRVGVRLHAWDDPLHYPENLRSLILPVEESLQQQLAGHAGLVTVYSTVAFDAAAAGLPVFFWDYGGLDLHTSEIALHGGGVVAGDLQSLCTAAARFLEDPLYHAQLQARAAAYRAKLTHDPDERRTWLAAIRAQGAPAALPTVISGLTAP